MKLFIDRRWVSKLVEMKCRQLKWTKVIKLLEISHFSLKLLQELPLLDHSNTFECLEEQAKILTTMDSLLALTHSIVFCFDSFQETEKVTSFKRSTLAVSRSSYHANSKSVHIMPGNPTSSTGAKQSGTIIHYTIFNIFTPLTLGILPKMEYYHSENSCFNIFI